MISLKTETVNDSLEAFNQLIYAIQMDDVYDVYSHSVAQKTHQK